MFGTVVSPGVEGLTDITSREIIVLTILAIAVLWLGVYPLPLTELMHVTVDDLLIHFAQGKL